MNDSPQVDSSSLAGRNNLRLGRSSKTKKKDSRILAWTIVSADRILKSTSNESGLQANKSGISNSFPLALQTYRHEF